MVVPKFEVLLEIAEALSGKWETTPDVSRSLDRDISHNTVRNGLRILKYSGIADYKLTIEQNGAQTPRWRSKESVNFNR